MKPIGAGLFVIGLIIVLAGLGMLGEPPQGLIAPRFILALTGVAVCAAGGMAWFRHKPVLNNGFAAVFLVALAWIGFWIAFKGSADHMSGGVPFLPDELNTSLGRILFGMGAVISAALALYAAALCRRALSNPDSDQGVTD